ncbi:hypothetical protein NW249_23740 [Streptomyces sp. OUCMDZ-4982]|uniref:hypothetical protein n=1 Tax=Streptomyces sp. OUCMDZ-4982 TaxID=2973090 RepID=UPI00215BD01A|nr:hypothetical protein [Streptomyces sp. OUCMDZ-4982]MCR8945134.1 hypothetical protein [Streptomyces sp. OUCMDZ-4982]
MTETQTPTVPPMTSERLFAYLDRVPHPPTAIHSESVSTLLLIAVNRTDTDPDETARLIQTAANAACRRYSNACLRSSTSRAGYTVLAARTCMIWLGSYLGYRLPRMPGGDLDLHGALDDLSDLLFGPRDSLAHAALRLRRTAEHRAGELRAVGAYTTVCDLAAYGSTTNIHGTHGRFVYNTLRLALPYDLPDPGTPTPYGPGHLTLPQALDRAMSPTQLRYAPAPGTFGLRAVTGSADALEAFHRATGILVPGVLGDPVRDARGMLPMLWYGPDADDGSREREAGEMLAVAYLLGGRYRGYYRRSRWRRLHIGLIVLAAETSIRTLSRLITQEHGHEGFEALDTLLEALHTRSALHFDQKLLPVTAVHQLLTRCGPLLAPWQHRALKVIARAVGTMGHRRIQQLAAISAEVYLQLREHPHTLARARRDAINAHLAEATEQHAANARLAAEEAVRRVAREKAQRKKIAQRAIRHRLREQQREQRARLRAELARLCEEQREERDRLRRDSAWTRAEHSVIQDRERALLREEHRAARQQDRNAEDDGFLDALTQMLHDGYPILAALQTLQTSTARLSRIRRQVPGARERITAAYKQGELARHRRAKESAVSLPERASSTRSLVIAALRDGHDLHRAAAEAGTTPRWVVTQYRTNHYFRHQVIQAYEHGEDTLLDDLETHGYTPHRKNQPEPE